MAYEQYANNAQNTLGAAITVTTSPVNITMSGVTGFPTTGNFRILIDSELMLVTAVSGTTFTCTRPIEGTSAATHTNGTPVVHILTAGSLEQLVGDRNIFGTMASLPAAGVVGRSYHTTDNAYHGIDDGTNWNWWYRGMPVTLPPTTGTWSTINALSSTVDQSTGSVVLSTTTSNGSTDKVSGRVRPVPGSTPYTLEWYIHCNNVMTAGAGGFARGGPCLYNSSGTGFLLWGLTIGSPGWYYTYFSAPSTFSSNIVSASQYIFVTTPYFCRMVDDGTHRNWYFGTTNTNMQLWLQESRTANLTATHYGIAIDAYSNGITVECPHLVGG